MRAFLVVLVCSGSIFGQAAFAQTVGPAAPGATTSTATQAPAVSQTPSISQTPAVSQAPSAPTAATKPARETVVVNGDRDQVNLDEVVCKSQPPATGTRLGGGRECLTVREWNQRERQAQDITRKAEIQGYNSFAAGH